ncbi:MAG TPA: winged helix-turn-helix domain-containing protein [Pyrinomonadaceae bacterium]|nr:winged helix-turn-helix domain-containing protein [Pyrinomonadaceae bacterium]
MEHGHNLHHFGPFCLDENDQVLLRAGRRVPLPAKALSTLIVLVRNKGHVVKKDDLMKEVWPNEFVEEGNLAQHIFMLRKAFGDTAHSPKYIETVPRRGYRFLGAIREINNASVPAEADQPSRSVHSVAVLPFVNDHNDPTTEYLADSITESIINSLSQLSQILSAKSHEIPEIQEKIAKHLVAVLPVSPSKDDQRSTRTFTNSPRAGQAYLKGRLCWCKHTREGHEQALEYFRQALEFDPRYALAYAAIVDCYLRLATNYFPPADSLPSAAVAGRAEAIEDLPPETLAALRLRCEWDKKSAEREIRRAIELKSNYPAIHQWNAACVVSQNFYLRGRDELKEWRKNTLVQDVAALKSGMRASDQFQSTILTRDEEVQILCLIAQEQIKVGNFEAACLVLQNWYTLGQWPILDRLRPHSCADLLFTVGWLAGSLASTRQVPKAQKHAEELLNGAIGIWEQLGLKRQSAQGQIELGLCYWREGLFDLARNSLQVALKELGEEDGELKTRGLINLAMNEIFAGRLHDALAYLNEAAPFVDQAGPSLEAPYNSILGLTFKELAITENRNEYFERGLEHYRKALYQLEAIGNYLYVAFVENNYGNLLMALKQLEKAESHIKRAGKLYERHSDKVYRAQFDDTQARFYIAAKQFDLAKQAITESLGTLEESGEEAWLVESLTTQGVLLCRVGRHRQAKRVLQRAYQIAERSGNREGAERALLILIEEMHDQLEDDERLELRAALDRLFVDPLQTSAKERRRKCLRLIA